MRIIARFFASLLLLVSSFVAAAQTGASWAHVRIGGTGNVTSIQAHRAVPNLFFATTDVGDCYRWNATTGAWEGMMSLDLAARY